MISSSTRLWDTAASDAETAAATAATSSSSSSSSTLLLQELNGGGDDDPEFDRLCKVHSVVEKLKLQIPTLLETPLTIESAKAVYMDDIKLVVDDIVLASSCEELQNLSTTLVLAVLATNQVVSSNSFFVNALVGGGGGSSGSSTEQQSKSSISQLESRMIMDPTSTAIRVEWKVILPSAGTAGSAVLGGQQQQQQRTLQGISELQLDPTTGKANTLRLLSVQFNQEKLNARAIGESLSNLRQLVMAFQNSPFIPKVGPSLSNLLGSDFFQLVSQQQQQQQSTNTKKTNDDDESTTKSSPLFITESLETAAAFVPENNRTTTTTTTTTTRNATTNETTATSSSSSLMMIPIDEYIVKNGSSLPLPGSKVWNQYVQARRVVNTFVDNTIRILSGNRSVSSTEMLELFSPQATLKATDGSELLRGRDPVGNFFHTVSSFRKRSGGTWELIQANLVSYDTYNADEKKKKKKQQQQVIKVSVDYRATSPNVPGSTSPVVIEGRDDFLLESSIYDNDKDEDDVDIVIKQIEQRKLNIEGGGGTGGGGRSPEWFMKSLVALDAGRLSSVGADSVVMELLQRVIAGENGRSSSSGGGGDDDETKQRRKRRRRTPPKLSDKVAARVYSIMSRLHEDVPTLYDPEMRRTYQLPPLHEYMTKEIELRGYLGESLARGKTNYNSAVGTTFASMKAALATGGAKLLEGDGDDEEPLVTTVELTAEGNIRLGLEVNLKVLPLPSGAGDIINSMSRSAKITLPSGGIPLKFAIVSDYVIDKDNGEIYQHRIVETRINGQLTPGDVMAKWIQKQMALSGGGGGSTNDDPSSSDVVQRGLMDAISWVRSVSGRG